MSLQVRASWIVIAISILIIALLLGMYTYISRVSDRSVQNFKSVSQEWDRIDTSVRMEGLGDVFVLREQPQKAAAAYKEAISFCPSNISAWYKLSTIEDIPISLVTESAARSNDIYRQLLEEKIRSLKK